MKKNAFYLTSVSLALAIGFAAGYMFGSRSIASSTPMTIQNPPTTITHTPGPTVGIGIMGDSNSDEYRADNARGGEHAETTLNWMEQLARSRGLNFGSWGTWGDARRTGYEYNWSRSGATTHSLLEFGQHTGLAGQVAEGKVSLVFLWIGDNDISLTNGTYEEIYNGSLSDEALQTKIDQIVNDIRTAVDTVLAAGPVKMVIVSLSDKGLSPQAPILFPNVSQRKRCTDAVNQVNSGIYALAAEKGIVVVDTNSFANEVFARVNSFGLLEVGNEKINVLIHGDNPYHMQLGDQPGHVGTVGSGLIANALFIKPFNEHYGLNIAPLSDEEILTNAGIH